MEDDANGGREMQLELVIQALTGVLTRHMMPGDQVCIGRTAHDGICLPHDRLLSRRHFRIDCRRDRVVLRDLHSTNGTYVNNRRVHFVRLQHGDLIMAGSSVFQIGLSDDIKV